MFIYITAMLSFFFILMVTISYRLIEVVIVIFLFLI